MTQPSDDHRVNSTEETRQSFRKNAQWAVIGFLLALIVITTLVQVVFRLTGNDINIYFSLATGLIITWMIVLVAFFIWAIQFYNVNHGWSMDAWKRHEEEKLKNTGDIPGTARAKAPEVNPHEKESLGLPNGTVRATIAITLMVGGLAMMIASFGMDSTLNANSFFVDNAEFFKTAFLMMIAFYFGNKSLDFLKNRSRVVGTPPVPEAPKNDPDFEDDRSNG